MHARGDKACLRAAPDGLDGGCHGEPGAPTDLPIGLADIEAAAARIAGAVVRTPTLLSRTLSEATGATV